MLMIYLQLFWYFVSQIIVETLYQQWATSCDAMFNSKLNHSVHYERSKDVGKHCPNYAYHSIWAYRSSCINTKIMLDQRSELLGGANYIGLHSEDL